MLEGLFSDNLSDNLVIIMCCTQSPGQAIEPISKALEMKWKDMNAEWKENACKWKENERTWMHIGMNMKGILKEMNAKWKEDACKWKESEGRCMQMNAKWKEHEVLPKHLKPTKQLLDPFPSPFRSGFWLHVGSPICINMMISTKPWKAIRLPKSDNHNSINYSDVKYFDGSSYIYIIVNDNSNSKWVNSPYV